MRLQMDPDWLAGVYAYTDQIFDAKLGPDISGDARRYCPVFGGDNSTATEVSLQIAASLGRDIPGGDLRDSIEYHLNDHVLVVAATGNDERSYAYWVETGHDIVVFGRETGRHKEAQEFLRPACYQERDLD